KPASTVLPVPPAPAAVAPAPCPLKNRAKTTSDLTHPRPHPLPAPLPSRQAGGPLPSDGRGRIVLRRSAHPAALEAARDQSGCSLSRRTGEGQGEGCFMKRGT